MMMSVCVVLLVLLHQSFHLRLLLPMGQLFQRVFLLHVVVEHLLLLLCVLTLQLLEILQFRLGLFLPLGLGCLAALHLLVDSADSLSQFPLLCLDFLLLSALLFLLVLHAVLSVLLLLTLLILLELLVLILLQARRLAMLVL